MANMKEFLSTYFNRMIFREMSYEQLVQFSGYVKDGKATDNQKIWANELLKRDPADPSKFATRPGTNIYIPEELPDISTELSDAELKKLFKAFQAAFQAMDGARKDLKHNDDAIKFLDQYFGSYASGTTSIDRLFRYTTATSHAKTTIGPAPAGSTDVTLHSFLTKYQHRLEVHLKNWGVITDDFSYQDLLSGIENEKYNKNPKFRRQMEQVAQVIDSYIAGDPSMQQKLGITDPRSIPNLDNMGQWFDDDNIHQNRLDSFKDALPELLGTLRKNKKARDAFANYDDGKISGPLNKALESLSYDDPKSDDYVQPKREDSLTMPERLAEWWSDTYSDCLEKYTKLKGDRLFFSPEAKLICKHLEKSTKKTEGLDDILKKLDDTKKKLKGAREFKAVKHLEWFEKTLNSLKADPKLSHLWNGALKNGTHLQAIAKEIIIRGVQEGKKDEAKTALELISVLHYDYTTSKIMDTLKKEDLTLFSDSKLSWNKNEGMQLVTKALDKGIRAAFLGIGYAVTIAGNMYNLSGSKINRYGKDGNFRKTHDAYLDKQQQEKTDLEDSLRDKKTRQTNLQATVDGIQGTRTYDVAKADIENNLQNITRHARSSKDELQRQIESLQQDIYDETTGTYRIPQNELDAITDFLSNLGNSTLPTVPALSMPTITTPTGTTNITHSLNRILLRQKVLNQRITDQNTEQHKLDQLIEGTNTLNELNEQIPRMEEAVRDWDANHVDEMEELVLHWNMLETGRNTRTGPMYNWFRNLSKKSAEARFGAEKSAIIANYNRTHSIRN